MSLNPDTNQLAIESDFRLGQVETTGLRYYYQFHLHMPCNQKCIMCIPSGHHPKTSMGYESFLEFFDQIKSVARNLTLIGGETLLYPHINKVLDLLAEHPIGVNIITNATMLNHELCEKLSRLHHLNLKCSIDAASAQTYYQIRGTKSFDRVVENLKMFSDYALGKEHIKQILVFVVMKKNLHEVGQFIEFASTLNPWEIQFHPVRHVKNWDVENGTGWKFKGAEQVCESFPEQYQSVMNEAQQLCSEFQIRCETLAV